MDSTTASYRLPDLHSLCPWKATLNPHYKEVATASTEWTYTYTSRMPELCDKMDLLARSFGELLAAYTFPHASAERLRICCDFNNLLFVFDEFTDDQSGSAAESTIRMLMDAFQDDNSAGDRSPLVLMLQDFKGRLFPTMGDAALRRFFRHFEDYLRAIWKEAELREEDIVLGIDAYEAQRRPCSAVHLVFDMIACVTGVDLPDAAFDHPEYNELYYAAMDMVTWSNDVYSYNIEQSVGHYACNVLTVLMRQNGVTLQEAADLVGVHFKTLVDRFEAAKARLPSFGEEQNFVVSRYVAGLEDWVVGNLEWSFATQRYFGRNHGSVKETLVVDLYPLRTA